MREIIFDYLRSQKKSIIYGYGNNGSFLSWYLSKHDIPVHFICDQNKELWGKRLNGALCISPEELPEHSDATILLSVYDDNSIYEWLTQYSFNKIWRWKELEVLYSSLPRYSEDVKEYLKRDLDKNPELKCILLKNKRYENLYKGKRGFVIGNGPSLNSQNLSLLRDEITFTVNLMPKNSQFESINTKYHFWADPGFFSLNTIDEDNDQLLNIMRQIPHTAEVFYPYGFARDFINYYNLERDLNINYFESHPWANDDEIDFAGFVKGTATVVQAALRMAIYMGLSEIYLLGCEFTAAIDFINIRASLEHDNTHCYRIEGQEKERRKRMYDRVPINGYFYNMATGFDDFNKLTSVCREKGIKIFNCTRGGLLDMMPRKEYEDVVNG